MEQLSSYAFAIGLIGGVHDLLTKRIPNWLTFPSMIVGIFAQIWLRSGSGFLDGFLGLILGFVLFFPIYLGGYMGAGDVKLQMAVGAWIGWRMAFYVAIGAILIVRYIRFWTCTS